MDTWQSLSVPSNLCCLHRPQRSSSACGNGSTCSSGKVAGLIFFEIFSYLWTSQVIGNIALVTLAGGPYGSGFAPFHSSQRWYYFSERLVLLWAAWPRTDGEFFLAMRSLSLTYLEQPKHPTLSALGRASTLSLGSIAFGSLIVTLLEILHMVLNAARNNADANGHRKCGLRTCSCQRLILCIQAVEVCLACCAECFIGVIENLVAYFNR